MNEADETELEANIDIDIGNNEVVLDGGIQGDDVDPKRNFEPALNNALDRICFNVSKFTPAFLTPDRIKIVIIVLVLAIAAFMFTSSTPSEGLYKNLLASASSDFPHYHTLNITNGRPEYLRVYISGQEINTEKNSKRIKVLVHLQEQQSENKWKTIMPNVLSITLKKDEEKNEVRILKVSFISTTSFVSCLCMLRLSLLHASHLLTPFLPLTFILVSLTPHSSLPLCSLHHYFALPFTSPLLLLGS
jgi:hypothetical protein